MEPEVVEMEIVHTDGASGRPGALESIAEADGDTDDAATRIQDLKNQMNSMKMHRDSIIIDRRRGSVVPDPRKRASKPRASDGSNAQDIIAAIPTRHKVANPQVVGLSGFGVTLMVMQFYNVGWLEYTSPVIVLGLVFGGCAQIAAGFQEFKHGNTFWYTAFVTYGSFFFAVAILLLAETVDTAFKVDHETIGYSMIAFTCYTFIITVGAFGQRMALFIMWCLLLLGLILLDIALFVESSSVRVAAGWVLLFCSIDALYVMSHVIYKHVFGTNILPIGPKPITLVKKLTQKNVSFAKPGAGATSGASFDKYYKK